MATYAELRGLFTDSDIKNKVATAIIIAAEGILNEASPEAKRKTWAAKAFASPQIESNRIMMAVIAANKTASVAAIQGASDSAFQTNVDAAINLFIDADAGV